jgi:Protein of unknown function (DUF3370)
MSSKINPSAANHPSSAIQNNKVSEKKLVTANQPEKKVEVPAGSSNKNPVAVFAEKAGINRTGLEKFSLQAKADVLKVVADPNLLSAAGKVSSAVSVDPTASVKIKNPLSRSELQPVIKSGSFAGSADLHIVDNPETFSKPGILGSTIAPVKGRNEPGDTSNVYTFTGSARSYALSQNLTGANQVFSVVAKNETNKPITVTVQGSQYINGSTKKSPAVSDVPSGYAKGKYGGPHAVAAESFIRGERNVNKTIVIPPGATVVLSSLNLPQAEVFSLLDIKTADKSDKFSLAVVASPKPLTKDQLKNLSSIPGAGSLTREVTQTNAKKEKVKVRVSEFAGADNNRLGRPNGVVKEGSVFTGGRNIEVGSGTSQGDILLATRFKNNGQSDSGVISAVLPNPAPKDQLLDVNNKPYLRGAAATINEGNYAATYRQNYTLSNNSQEEKTVQVIFSSPLANKDSTAPPPNSLGGAFTQPVKINGQIVRLRVEGPGEGQVVATIKVPPGGTVKLPIEFTNFGNTTPPIGIEFRPVAN